MTLAILQVTNGAVVDASGTNYVVAAAGGELLATYAQLAIAAGQTAQEVLDAILAAGLSEGVFPSEAAGLSSTTDGQYFWVGDSGTVTLYLNDTGAAEEIAELATAVSLAGLAAALASPTGGEMVGMPDSGSAADAIMAATTPITLAATTKSLVEDSTIRTADGHLYRVLASDAVDYDLETAGGAKLAVVPVANSVALSAFAADPSGITGSADALVVAWNATPEGGTFVIDGDYKIEKEVDLPDRNIDILCRGSLRVAAGSFTGIFIEKLPDFELPGTDLVAPLKGDAKLVWDTGKTPAATANEYYVTLESTEVLINRIGGGGYAPYTKNEIHSISADDWTLFDPILYTYTDLSKLTVRLFKKGRQRDWSSLRVVAAATGSPDSRSLLYLRGLSNINLRSMLVDASEANGAGYGLTMHRCCHIDLDSPRVFGFNAQGVDSYKILNSLSAHITLNRYVSESEPSVGTALSRCYVARHGNQVRFNDCTIVGGDDHFGSNYFLRGGSISRRGFGFAGANFSAVDVTVTNVSGAAFFLRTDTPYADGRLELRDIRLDAGSFLVDNRPLQTQSPDLLVTDYKFYDRVEISNITVGEGNQVPNQYIWLGGVPNRAWFTMHRTTRIVIDDVRIDAQRQTIGQCTVRMGNFDFGRLRVSRFGEVDAATAYYGDIQWWSGTQPADMVFEIVDCPAITSYFFGTANGQKMIVRNSTIGGMGGASNNAMFNIAVTTKFEMNGVVVNKTITCSGSGGGVTLDMVNTRFLVQPKAAFNSAVTIVRGIGSGMDNSLGALPAAFPGKMLSYLDATVWKS